MTWSPTGDQVYINDEEQSKTVRTSIWRDLSSVRGAARDSGFDEFLNISLVVSSILGCHPLFLALTRLFRETAHRSCWGRTSRSGTAVARGWVARTSGLLDL